MLNLAYPITEQVEINGESYELDMSFDNILRLFDMLNDKGLSEYQKVILGIEMLIGTSLDMPIDEQAEIFKEIFKSALGNEKEDAKNVDLDGNPMPTPSGSNKKAYDLTQDAGYVYASFMHCYQIDLFEMQGMLHWHKFVALLNGLGEDSIFSRVVGIRTAELPTGKGTEKERECIRKLKREYALKEDDEDDS